MDSFDFATNVDQYQVPNKGNNYQDTKDLWCEQSGLFEEMNEI